MKPLLLILALALSASAQALDKPEWVLIKEMSGEFRQYPGLSMNVYGARIARAEEIIKISMRFEFPSGAPFEIFKDAVPQGFDVSSVERFEGRIQLNCKTLAVKATNDTGYYYQFNGKRHKSKEPPFATVPGNLFKKYFCEDPSPLPTSPPQLKKANP